MSKNKKSITAKEMLNQIRQKEKDSEIKQDVPGYDV